MTVNVVTIPATLTIDASQTFTMQGLFNTVYASLPPPTVISATGVVGGVSSISPDTGPWSATVSGMTTTNGFLVGDKILGTNGTGQLYGGNPTSAQITKIGTTSLEYTVVGGTTPVSGTVTNVSRSQYTVTGISLQFLGIPCSNSGVMDTYADIKTQISLLYNKIMKSYLQPIWDLLNNLLKSLQNIVGGIFDIDLTLPVLGFTVNDLFSDNLYQRLIVAITNLYNNSVDELKRLLNLLGIPFEPFGGLSSPSFDIVNIAKNVLASLWGAFYQKIKKIIDYIKTALTAYDIATEQPTPTFQWSTVFSKALDILGQAIIDFLASGGLTVQQILDDLIAFAKAFYNKTVVTAQDILNCIQNFTLPVFGKPFDWVFPINPGVNAPWKDINQLIGDIKMFCSNIIGTALASFIKAIEAILSLFGLSFNFPVVTINYSACAVENNPQGG